MDLEGGVRGIPPPRGFILSVWKISTGLNFEDPEPPSEEFLDPNPPQRFFFLLVSLKMFTDLPFWEPWNPLPLPCSQRIHGPTLLRTHQQPTQPPLRNSFWVFLVFLSVFGGTNFWGTEIILALSKFFSNAQQFPLDLPDFPGKCNFSWDFLKGGNPVEGSVSYSYDKEIRRGLPQLPSSRFCAPILLSSSNPSQTNA